MASAIRANTYTVSNLSDAEYHQYSDKAFELMVEYLEEIGDTCDLPGFDIEYSQGVMTLRLGSHGTYVINKQPPNKQIWLSSPKSGPKRYDFDKKHQKWFYGRDNHTLDELLNEELTDIFKQRIEVPLTEVPHKILRDKAASLLNIVDEIRFLHHIIVPCAMRNRSLLGDRADLPEGYQFLERIRQEFAANIDSETIFLRLNKEAVASLQAFRKRNEEARRVINDLAEQKTDVDFAYYRSVLKNQDIAAQAEKTFKEFKPTTYSVDAQIANIEKFEAAAVERAQNTVKQVESELADLNQALKDIESTRPVEQLTVDDVLIAKPDLNEKVERMLQKGKWSVPGYKEKFGDISYF
ncbi:hypothetical protein BZG36_04234 [Bifiguratus adelaidae]|uniref:ATP synthase subunit d, mitochondrial n=1 Tax=Bifiguratus adelaidae TaxID=1938954 RepID=A0A261Y0U8_9FUNG|nr:hypothetical protein BZG36_04234 [Bifiguratus adelaidae]